MSTNNKKCLVLIGISRRGEKGFNTILKADQACRSLNNSQGKRLASVIHKGEHKKVKVEKCHFISN